MQRWSRATVIFFPLSVTIDSVEPRIEGSARRWIGVGVVNPRWRRALRRRGGNPRDWKDPPPVKPLDCFASLPFRTSAAPSDKFLECWRDAREANKASSAPSSPESVAAAGAGLDEVEGLVRTVFVGLREVDGPRRADEMST